MRGLEITLLLICIILAIPLVNIALPAYNNGQGVPIGAQDTSGLNAFNWSKLSSQKNVTSMGVVDQASYYFSMAQMALFGIGTILFSALWTAPMLISIFGIPPAIAGILLSIFAIVLLLALWQIIKGDDWSGRL
jgi:hypothetical protein